MIKRFIFTIVLALLVYQAYERIDFLFGTWLVTGAIFIVLTARQS